MIKDKINTLLTLIFDTNFINKIISKIIEVKNSENKIIIIFIINLVKFINTISKFKKIYF